MSCLFVSLQYFLNDSNVDIRNKICDYLTENKPILDGLETNTILNMENPNYIQDMRKINTWGGAIEIQAACNIWGVKVIVKDIRNNENNDNNKNNQIEFIPVSNSFNTTIYLEWNGCHYEPIKKL